ncbi:hypothetical protein LR48_Vigan02g150000 [Vigna angularis]|uniref:Uncharacterized protein n=1 Tax=Phaseolus angularis TaxID=3914 RepID=A0A0L9TXS4_PHAAN|nr:hypothetical protein LR48_Vigan02g150000 [Vigna angularis]
MAEPKVRNILAPTVGPSGIPLKLQGTKTNAQSQRRYFGSTPRTFSKAKATPHGLEGGKAPTSSSVTHPNMDFSLQTFNRRLNDDKTRHTSHLIKRELTARWGTLSTARSSMASNVKIFCHSASQAFSYSTIRPHMHSVIRPYKHSTIRPYRYSIIRHHRHSVIRPHSHSTLQEFGHSASQTFIHSASYLPLQSRVQPSGANDGRTEQLTSERSRLTASGSDDPRVRKHEGHVRKFPDVAAYNVTIRNFYIAKSPNDAHSLVEEIGVQGFESKCLQFVL